MIDLEDALRQLAANAEAIRALVAGLPEDQATWRPDPDTWSMAELMGHLLNEERRDFRRHLVAMFGHPIELPAPVSPRDCPEALERFLEERADSLRWLTGLAAPDWSATVELRFGPGETLRIRADDMLRSWVEHDYLHMRQMVELLHAFNAARTDPGALAYAGGW